MTKKDKKSLTRCVGHSPQAIAAKTPHSHVSPELTAPRPNRLFLRTATELSVRSDSLAITGGCTVLFIVRSYEMKHVGDLDGASTKSKHSLFTIFFLYLLF